MKNTITILLVSIFLLTTASVSADYDGSKMEKKGMEKHQELEGVDDDTKAEIKELHESMKIALEELKESYGEDMSEDEKEELRAKVKEMRSELHDEVVELLGDNEAAIAQLEERKEKMEAKHAEMMEKRIEKKEAKEALLAELDDDTRAELETLHEEHKAAVSELKEGHSDDMTDEEKEELKAEFDTLRTAHEEAVTALLADYPEVLEAMQAKKESRDGRDGRDGNKKGERTEKVEKKGNHDDARSEKRGKYKKQFTTKYQARLEKASDEKLEKVLDRIDAYTVKIEANEDITDERKENVLAQLEALAEMIQDILDGDDTDDIIEEILN